MAVGVPETSSRVKTPTRSLTRKFAALLFAIALGGLSLAGGAVPAVAAPTDLSIADIIFTDVHVGTSNSHTFTLINNSATDAQDITGLSFASMGETQTTITDDQCGGLASLGPGASCTIEVDFHPTVIESVYIHGIAGTLEGTYISGTLRGNTVASLEALDGLDFDFGQVPVGEEAIRTLLLTNTSGHQITVPSATGGSGGFTGNPFTRSSDCEGEVLAPGEKCSLVYSFKPTDVGTFTYDSFTTVGLLGSHFVPTFIGEGVAWSVSPQSINLGSVPLGSSATHEITVTNVSAAAQEMPAMSETYSAPFSLSTLDCTTGFVIQPQESCTVTLSFDAAQVGLQETSSDTGLNIGDAEYPISAQALVFDEPNFDMWHMDPLTLDFGEVLVGESQTLTSTLTFVGEGVGVYFPKVINLGAPFEVVSDCVDFAPMAVGESCTFSVTFTPTTTGDFSDSDTFQVWGSDFELSVVGTGSPISQVPADSPDVAKDGEKQALDRTDLPGGSGLVALALALSAVGGILLLRRRHLI